MAGNHITPMLAGNGMVAQGIQGKTWAEGAVEALSQIHIPSHHFKAICNCEGSMCRLRPGEGITESQAAAMGEETDCKLALSGKDELSKRSLN